jgi:hypothetical protein
MPPRPALNRNALLFCNSDFAEELLIARCGPVEIRQLVGRDVCRGRAGPGPRHGAAAPRQLRKRPKAAGKSGHPL